MWNNFSSSFASVSSPGPKRSSSSNFHRSDTNSLLSRESPPRSSLREYSRSNSTRDPLSSPLLQRRATDSRRSDHSSRVTRDSETAGLLERYGARRGSATETSTQSLLKQRKQSEPDSGLFTRGTARDGTASFGLGATTSRYGGENTGSTWAQATPAGQMQSISQQDYMNRLMAAHTRVDELLRSRGLNSDDEGKYLRAWEQIPIIREERFRRLRSPSNSSDSGLSTDNDSDRSNAEPPVSEETVEVKGDFEQAEDDVCAFDVFFVKSKVQESVAKTIKAIKAPEPSVSSVVAQFTQAEQRQSCSLISPLARSTFTKAKILPSLKSAPIKEEKEKSPPVEAIVSRNLNLIKKTCQLVCNRVWKDRRMQKTTGKFEQPTTNEIEKHFSLRRRRTIDPSTTEQRRQVLSSIKRKSAPPIPSSAEISIQHCSFFQVKKNAVTALSEKNVRINLRLTERAPKNCAASITLPAPPRVAYARLDIPAEMPRMRRTMSTQIIPQEKKRVVGKLERGFTVDLAEVPREQRKVNRLKIPEYFLQESAESVEDINDVRNKLKRIPTAKIVGGFVYELKPQPQSGLKRAGAIRRRPAPVKPPPIMEPFADFLPAEPPDPDPPPNNSCHPNETGHLNLPGSLDRPVTSSGALTLKESSIAELSETDRRLVEQFRRSLNIPCPQVVRRALSPFTLRCFQPETEQPKKSSNAKWIYRKNPKLLEVYKERCPSPPCLRRAYRNTKKVTKYIFGEWTVTLKRVDKNAPLRPKPKRRRLPKWIPRWRRKHRSEEEVEEVEEEEVEEEVEEEEEKPRTVPSDEPRHERVISKTYNDEEEGSLTEGEKAMAAAKRRHEEEQQAKLLDYEEKRRIEREKEEEELRRLKEKQEKRRLEREQEEREMLERRQQEEDRRKREEEERKARVEEEKRKKEESNRKKNQITGGAFTSIVNAPGGGGRNFTIPKKSDTVGDKFGNIVQAKQEMGMTKDQQEQAKQAFMAQIAKGILEASKLPAGDLKKQIKDLHQRICKLEADKYDLEKRHERQEYDLKELNERQRQVARSNAVKKGLDPVEAGNSRHPPRVRVVSKYENLSEGLTFSDRRNIFLNLNKTDKSPEIAKGSAKPPPNWGKKVLHEDIEAYLRNPDRCPKFTEKNGDTSDDTKQ